MDGSSNGYSMYCSINHNSYKIKILTFILFHAPQSNLWGFLFIFVP